MSPRFLIENVSQYCRYVRNKRVKDAMESVSIDIESRICLLQMCVPRKHRP